MADQPMAVLCSMGQPFDPQHRQYPPQQSPGGYSTPRPPVRPARPIGPAIAGLIGGLLLAVVVGAVLAVTGVLHFGAEGKEPARVSSAAITLPASLPGFQDYVAANKAARTKSSSGTSSSTTQVLEAQRANSEKVSSLTKAAYQQANPGAAVAFGQYSDATIEHQVSVVAVRATYPGLTNGPVIDPAYLKLTVAPQRIQSFGDVQCLVASAPTPAGRQPDPKQMYTAFCQRTGPALTVLIYGGNFSGTDGQQSIVNLTNATWTAIAG
jgi:hypothetical protein